MDPATVKGNRQALPTMSPAPVRSCHVLAPDPALCQSAGERDWRLTRCRLVPFVVPVLASQVAVTDLAALMLMAEPSASSL